jgi:hypothetical protein
MLLRDQILARVMFNGDGLKPGFFEFDRVSHCGADASGRFCQALTGAVRTASGSPGPSLPQKRQSLRGAEKRRCGAEDRGVSPLAMKARKRTAHGKLPTGI